MPPCLFMTGHVVHLAGKTALEPILKTREAVSRAGGSNAGPFKTQSMGLFFDACFERHGMTKDKAPGEFFPWRFSAHPGSVRPCAWRVSFAGRAGGPGQRL